MALLQMPHAIRNWIASFAGTESEEVVPSPFIFGVPSSPVDDEALEANQISFWSNDASNLLAFKMKNSTGVVKTGTIALT